MLAVQVVGIVFAILMMYVTMMYGKRKELNTREQAVWFLVWFAIILLSVFHKYLDTVAVNLQFNRTLDLMIVGAILFVVTTSFYTYAVMRRTQEKVEKLVRNIALQEKEHGKK